MINPERIPFVQQALGVRIEIKTGETLHKGQVVYLTREGKVLATRPASLLEQDMWTLLCSPEGQWDSANRKEERDGAQQPS